MSFFGSFRRKKNTKNPDMSFFGSFQQWLELTQTAADQKADFNRVTRLMTCPQDELYFGDVYPKVKDRFDLDEKLYVCLKKTEKEVTQNTVNKARALLKFVWYFWACPVPRFEYLLRQLSLRSKQKEHRDFLCSVFFYPDTVFWVWYLIEDLVNMKPYFTQLEQKKKNPNFRCYAYLLLCVFVHPISFERARTLRKRNYHTSKEFKFGDKDHWLFIKDTRWEYVYQFHQKDSPPQQVTERIPAGVAKLLALFYTGNAKAGEYFFGINKGRQWKTPSADVRSFWTKYMRAPMPENWSVLHLKLEEAWIATRRGQDINTAVNYSTRVSRMFGKDSKYNTTMEWMYKLKSARELLEPDLNKPDLPIIQDI
jgi:hypothetical protein